MDSQQEQLFHDLEQRHVSLRKEHEAVCIERDALRGENTHIYIYIYIHLFFIARPSFFYLYSRPINSFVLFMYLFRHSKQIKTLQYAAKVEALTKSNEELRESMITIRKELETKDTEIKQRDRKITELEQSVEDVTERYRRRSEEADRLRDDIKMQAEQLTSQQSRLERGSNISF